MTSVPVDTVREQQKTATSGSLYTALAQTTTRTLALYFSRPVRLFRPSKCAYTFYLLFYNTLKWLVHQYRVGKA
jgi:hypothetical protein